MYFAQYCTQAIFMFKHLVSIDLRTQLNRLLTVGNNFGSDRNVPSITIIMYFNCGQIREKYLIKFRNKKKTKITNFDCNLRIAR